MAFLPTRRYASAGISRRHVSVCVSNQWWANKAQELQQAADWRDMKAFYHGLRAVYGPRDSGSVPVRSRDGSSLITDRQGILSRWAEHFHSILNQTSSFLC